MPSSIIGCERGNITSPEFAASSAAVHRSRLSRHSGTRLCSAVEARAAALADSLEGDVEHRDHEDPNCACGDHPGEDRRPDIVPADLGGALRDDQRVDAED